MGSEMIIGNAGAGRSYQAQAATEVTMTGAVKTTAIIMSDGLFDVNSLVASSSFVSNANGSPVIPMPKLEMSPEDQALHIADLSNKQKEAQTRTATVGLSISKNQMAANLEKALAKITEWKTNTLEAAAAVKAEAEKSWFDKICSAIGAICLAIVVAPMALTGVGAPLALAAVTMAFDAVVACENNARACEEPPREPMDSPIGSPGVDMCAGFLEACGVDSEIAKSAGQIMFSSIVMVTNPGYIMMNPAVVGDIAAASSEISLADEMATAKASGDDEAIAKVQAKIDEVEMWATLITTIVVAVASIVCTCGGSAAGSVASGAAKVANAASKASVTIAETSSTLASGAAKVANVAGRVSGYAASAASKMPQMGELGKTAQLAMGAAGFAQGAMGVTSGILAVEIKDIRLEGAEAQKDASIAQADKSKLEARNIFLQRLFEEGAGDIEKLAQEMMENASLVTQMISSASETSKGIALNMGQGPMNAV